MAFYANVGYRFVLGENVNPDGSVILVNTIPIHQLARRGLKNHSHLKTRLVDPQLYLTSLDARRCKKQCARLASYPWFGIKGLDDYDSKQHHQSAWMEHAEEKIAKLWIGEPPSLEKDTDPVRACIDFQASYGCWAVILPSPLTQDPSTDYSEEENWLDMGLEYISSLDDFHLPTFATVAISDLCLRMKPEDNQLLDMIIDSVSAREGLDGVYLVVEQASEPNSTRNCGNARTLASVLRLVHAFSNDAGLRVGVNFLGPFGLACEAAGAEWWASNWYVSLRRLRLQDFVTTGRAFPLYWSYPTILDIHLDNDFDDLVNTGLLSSIKEATLAADGLHTAAESGRLVNVVAAWAYRQSNVTASIEHYLQSAIKRERSHSKHKGTDRLDGVESWLKRAVSRAKKIGNQLGSDGKTNTQHVSAWLEGFVSYRKLHKV